MTVPVVRSHVFGSSYYPPHHDGADWARDLDRMRDAGQTVVRTAELLASWDRLEVAKHTYDWSWLDTFFDLCEQRDMKVLLGTGSQNPPIWMIDEHDDLPIVTADGVPYPTAAMWSWACKQHPAYREEVERHVRTLAARYGSRPGLYGWQVDNEVGYPFVPRRGGEMELFDYNPHSQRAFVVWLQERYGTLEALSEAWRWDPTNHRYSSWTQVRAPRAMPAAWAVVTAWLDWREFGAQQVADLVGWQASMLKEATPTLPVSTNMNVWSRHDAFGVQMCQDSWRIARTVDAIGFDLYPGIGKRFAKQPEFVSMHHAFARSAARAAGVELWYPEIESGPLNGWALGPDHATTPDDITRLNVSVLGAGSRVTLYQGWREWDCIPIHWGALVDLEGEPTPRRDAAASVAAAVGSEPEVFAEAEAAEPDVAVYVDRVNAVCLQGFDAGAELYDAMAGAFRSLHGFETGFVAPDTIDGTAARLVLVPMAMLLPAEAGALLAQHVEAGGHLLTSAKVAMLDHRGWYHRRRPGAGLDDLLGVREVEIDTTDEAVVVHLEPTWAECLGTDHLLGAHHVQTLRLVADDVEVVGRFDDGTPALTRRAVGAGVAWACGTHLDLGLHRDPASGYDALVAAVATEAGAQRRWTSQRCADGLDRVWVQVRHHGPRRLVAVTSTAREPRHCAVGPGGTGTDLLTGAPVDLADLVVPALGGLLVVTGPL